MSTTNTDQGAGTTDPQSLFGGEADPGPAPSATLPVPPLRLRRVILDGIGPAEARFDPLDLHFTTRQGAASRVLLSLANTGGKSTWITLVSSLVVPHADAQVGGATLGDYVLTGDTAHVICEWEDALTGTRTVTGTVMEWKDGKRQPPEQQRSPQGLRRRWYLYRTGPGLPTIDEIARRRDGRRVDFASFSRALDELFEDHPGAQGVAVIRQSEWTDVLEARTSIDPVLFRFQMRMNNTEAGAEALLESFDTADNVVRFFIGALNDERELAGFTRKLGEYAVLAAERPQLEARAAFGQQVVPLLDGIADRASALSVAEAEHVAATRGGTTLAGSLQARITADRERVERISPLVDPLRTQQGELGRSIGRLENIRAQLSLEAARDRLARAETHVVGVRADHEAAELDARAWDAVQDVVDLARSQSEYDTIAEQVAREAADLQPARDAVTSHSRTYAGRLDVAIGDAEERARSADQEAERLDEVAEAEREAWRRDSAEASRLQEKLEGLDATLDRLDVDLAGATAGGTLEASEAPVAAAVRWERVRDDHRASAERHRSAAGELATEQRSLAEHRPALQGRLTAATSARDAAAFAVRSFLDDLAAFDALPGRDQLFSGPSSTLDVVARTVELAGSEAGRADARASAAEQRHASATDELARLDEAGTAPAAPDAIAVVDALRAAGVAAVTGLAWVEANVADPEERTSFVTSHPAFSSGAVVVDGGRWNQAVEVLRGTPPIIRSAVVVSTRPGTDDAHAPEVVVPHRATFDRQWAATRRAELIDIVDASSADLVKHRAAARDLRRIESSGHVILDRHADDHAALVEALDAADAELGHIAQELAAHDDRAEAVRSAIASHGEERVAELSAAEEADRHQRAAATLAERAEAAVTQRAQRQTVAAAVTAAEGRASEAKDRARDAAGSARDHREQAAQLRAQLPAWLAARAALHVTDAVPVHDGNLDVLAQAWQAAQDELAAQEAGLPSLPRLQARASALEACKRRMDRHRDPRVVARADELSGTIDAADSTAIAASRDRAQQRRRDTDKFLVRAEQAVKNAAETVRTASPSESSRHRNHIDLTAWPEWQPTTAEDIPELTSRVEDRLEVERARLAASGEQLERYQADIAAATDDMESFAQSLQLWPLEAPEAGVAFDGTRREAQDAMVSARKTFDAAAVKVSDAERQLSRSVIAARNCAHDHAELQIPLRQRVAKLEERALAEDAAHLATDVRADVKSVHADLAASDEHRNLLRDDLLVLCRDQRRLLRKIVDASKLPAGLRNLTGMTALRIGFADAPDDEAGGRLAVRVDGWARELAENPRRAASAEQRIRWLAQAVRDTVVDRPQAGPFKVEILKPMIDNTAVYRSPSRIREFSGGQELTLAVLVYCALSKVRSAHRPSGQKPPGALILDNPFGKASNGTLIAMQHRLAAHNGVQVVCATGLHDAAVDEAFSGPGSVIVKLRNDGDLRRNLSYLRLTGSTAADLFDGRDTTDDRNYLDAVSYRFDEP